MVRSIARGVGATRPQKMSQVRKKEKYMTNKLTKRDYFNMIKAAMVDNADVITFCDKEIALLDKKAQKASGPKKEFVELEAAIVDYLTANTDKTATDVANALGYTSQKVTPRLKALIDAGTVTSTRAKGKNYFKVA